MVLGWVSIRWAASQRAFTVTLLASVLAISGLYTLLEPHSLPGSRFRVLPAFDPSFGINLDCDSEFDWVSGPVVQGELVKLDLQLPQGSEPALNQAHIKCQAQPLGNHTITPDGLLIVNPNGPHPIFQLIRDAEAAWEAKHTQASKTLDEAVSEYKRRYRRAPPLGFDKWWDYVVKHNVQLPDEYDEIFNDIEPFWGIDPAELALTQEKLEGGEGLVTIQKTDTHRRLEVVRSTLLERNQNLQATVDDILDFIREVEQDLPPLRFTMSPFDNPNMLSDWRIKTMALEAAANGTTLTRADFPPIKELGWIQACPPDSPARLHPPILPYPSTNPSFPHSSPKTFIASHRDAMNPCTNPSLLTTHGQFLSHEAGPFPQRTLVPRFSLCSTLLHHDIRPPVPYGWRSELDSDPYSDEALEGDVPWEHKVDGRLAWRGRTTGMYADPKSLWVHAHRARLVTFASALEGNVSVLRVHKNAGDGTGREERTPVGEPETVRVSSVNPAWMDIAFSGRAISCDRSAGTCDEMEKLWEFRKVQGKHEEDRYKFIFDIDGNGWSSRFKRLITSNALIFKATIYPEWYMSRIAPWVHYVPIQMSYADLYDAVAFFRAHDELAARIAKAGRDWSRRFWRREDMTAYLYRLLLEYARVSSLDRASMDYVG